MVRAAPGRPAPDDGRARELFRTARFSEAAQVLDDAETAGALDPQGALLRARLLLIRDPARALTYLTERAKLFSPKALRCESAAMQGAALTRLGDHASAAARFRSALEFAGKDAALSAYVTYQQAASAWIQRELSLAERILERVDWSATSDTLRLEQYVLRGAIEASRGNMAEQGGILLEALDVARSIREPSVLHQAYVVSQISYLARELYSPSLRTAAYEEVPKVPWTEDLADTHFTALRAVAWCHALEGDYFNAFRRLKEAAGVAPSPARRVMSLCDRSYLAGCLGETRWAEQERSDARELAATVDWSSSDGEERFALCLLAELYAETDGPLALAQIAEYRKAGGRFAAVLASASDRRVTALESYSLGTVQLSLGDTAEAIRLLSQSYDIYAGIGYRWRAGRAAKSLAQITGSALWSDRAANALSVYPRSWLAAEQPARHAPALAGVAQLTASQRAVYQLLVRGLSTKEIARELGRSEFTVRNHVKAIFKACGVRSRASLIAKVTGTQSRGGPQ